MKKKSKIPEVYKKIRKPMPPPEKIIPNKKRKEKYDGRLGQDDLEN